MDEKKTLIDYFGESCRYCNERSVDSIIAGVKSVFSREWIDSGIRSDKINLLEQEWKIRADNLKQLLASSQG